MSEGAGTTNWRPSGKRGRETHEPKMLPQWAINLAHPATHLISKTLWRIRFRGTEHIPPTEAGGLIIAANHQTYVDPFWISIPIMRPLRFLAWSEAFRWPVLGRLMELFGSWPLQVEGSDPTAIRRSLQWLRKGGALTIFPEGERALADGEMKRFKAGAARMALEAGVPILPVTIRGAHRVWPRGWRVPRLAQIEIVYHPLRKLTPLPGEDTRACARRETEALAAVIKSAL